MGQITRPNSYVDGTPADPTEVNDDFDTIYDEFNGSITSSNIDLDDNDTKNDLKEAIGDLLFPVGSIYTNAEDDTNPEDLLGFGTWEKFAEGRTLVGLDDSDSDFDTAEKTGGSKTHTLTENEIPSHDHGNGDLSTSSDGSHSHSGSTDDDTHNHSYEDQYVSAGPEYAGSGNDKERVEETKTTSSDTHSHSLNIDDDGSHSHSVNSGSTGNTGGGESHNNLQPYITVYMWKRTA